MMSKLPKQTKNVILGRILWVIRKLCSQHRSADVEQQRRHVGRRRGFDACHTTRNCFAASGKERSDKQKTNHFKIVSFLMVGLTISSNYVRLCNLKLVPNFITKQRVNLFSQQTCHDFLIIGPLSTKVYSLCRWKSFTRKFYGFKLP
jgi:hypothetical protein